MIDPRMQKLAKMLINYSVDLKKGEKVSIEVEGECNMLVRLLIQETYRIGATPFVHLDDDRIRRALLMNIDEEAIKLRYQNDAQLLEQVDATIYVRASDNSSELSDVPTEKMQLERKLYRKPINDIIDKKKWTLLNYVNSSFAQQAKMSTDEFEDFFFNVCTLDYAKMGRAMESLVRLMDKTDKVRIKGPGDTDISFSIKGIPAIKCAGDKNVPDGEVYTAPVKNSVNGVIHYNTPSPYQGFTFNDVRLTFKDGKIIEATSNDSKRINQIFDTDGGARYVGEFAIGLNPYITKPMEDILFDEKIAGSIHFTPGDCYEEASNGNESAIHWDMVLIQTPAFGGGEIYFDDVLVRKDGLFVVPELLCLNPDALK